MSSAPIDRPIYVDMNYSGGNREVFRVYLTRPGPPHPNTFEESTGITLADGLVLHLFDHDLDAQGHYDDLVMEGVVHYDGRNRVWVATCPQDDLKHLSEVRSQPEHWANQVDWEALHRGRDPSSG